VYLLARARCVICQSTLFQHMFQFLFTFYKNIGDVWCTLKLFQRFSHCLDLCSLMGCMGKVGGGRCLELYPEESYNSSHQSEFQMQSAFVTFLHLYSLVISFIDCRSRAVFAGHVQFLHVSIVRVIYVP
jgi:hypothetical protein